MGIAALKARKRAEARSLAAQAGAADWDLDSVVLSPMDKAIARMVVTPARATAAVDLTAVVAVSVYAYTEFGLHRTLDVDPARLTISTVSASTFHEYIPITGNIVPRTTVYLDAVEGGKSRTSTSRRGRSSKRDSRS